MAAVNRLNDNTFFILSALKYEPNANVSQLSLLYRFETLATIYSEIERIKNEFKEVEVEVYAASRPSKTLRNELEELETTLEDIVADFNSSTLDVRRLNKIENLKDFIGFTLTLTGTNEARFRIKLNNYFKNQRARVALCSDKEHLGVIKKYLASPDGKRMGSTPKTKLSRYTNQIKDYSSSWNRYNLFHFFQQLEIDGDIRINSFHMDEDEPTIDYCIVAYEEFLVKTLKKSVFIKRYGDVYLHNNKIDYFEKSVPIKRKGERKLLQHCLNIAQGRINKDDISSITNYKRGTEAHSKSAVNRIIQELIADDAFELLERIDETNYKIHSLAEYLRRRTQI